MFFFPPTFSTWHAKLAVTSRDKQTVLTNCETIAANANSIVELVDAKSWLNYYHY